MKVLNYIEKGKQDGATLLAGGKRIGEKGYFIEPTVFSDCTDDMSIVEEEIFGPVIACLKFSSMEEVIQRANNTKYGLAAGVLTQDLFTAHKMAKELEAGTVWVNSWNVFDANLPFGGYKQSGFGKDSSVYALKNFTKHKAVVISLPGFKNK